MLIHRTMLIALVLAGLLGCDVDKDRQDQPTPVREAESSVTTTNADELILTQELWVAAPVKKVWAAYTTSDGWTAWAAPRAEVNLRVGGTIRTAYQGEIGGDDTITIHIVNYVPNTLLTLRTDVSENWPAVMKEDADRLSNVILFDEFDGGYTRIRSYGIGYSDAPEYEQLMTFFIEANEHLYGNLKSYVEAGSRVSWDQ